MAAYSHLRCFVSSTFRDMHGEREELLKFVFPQLRRFCAKRGLVWSDVDLRWGITQEQAERGDVLPICLAEIDRCRPLFLCMLGERYGWIPPTGSLPAALLAVHPWLSEHPGASVTELEIRYGALNQEFRQSTHALFYFRDPCDVDVSPEADRADGGGSTEWQQLSRYRQDRLRLLKEQIRLSGHPVCEGYGSPRAFGERVLEDLTALIERLVSLPSEQSELDRDAADHEAFARDRRDVYVAPGEYVQHLDRFVHGDGGRGLLVFGEPGAGKSALLANWLSRFRSEHPDHAVVYHAIGATPQSADGSAMLRRLIGECRRPGNAPADGADGAVAPAEADPPDMDGGAEGPRRLARMFQSVLGQLERHVRSPSAAATHLGGHDPKHQDSCRVAHGARR
jgi:hypothetical protein